MLAASHIGDSPARPTSIYDSPSYPAGHPSGSVSSSTAIIPPRVSSNNLLSVAGSGAGAGLPLHSAISRSPGTGTSPLPSPSYFHRSSSSIQGHHTQHQQRQQHYPYAPQAPSESAQSLAQQSHQHPERRPRRSGSISGLRFMSITKAPRALKRLASAGGGTLKDSNQQLSPDPYDEELENRSVGHGSLYSGTQHSHMSRPMGEHNDNLHSRWDAAAAAEDSRHAQKAKGFGKAVNLLRFGQGPSAKSHHRDASAATGEHSLDSYRAQLKAAVSSQEQLALLAQGPGQNPSGGLIRKASLTLRKRAPSLSSFAFPNNASQTAPNTPAATQYFKSASSDSGHSSGVYRTVSGSTITDVEARSRVLANEPRKHYPPPSASTGASAAYTASRSATGVVPVKRKPVPGKNLSIDSSMLLQPSSFSSPSRVRHQQSSPAIDGLVRANAPDVDAYPYVDSRPPIGFARDVQPSASDAGHSRMNVDSSKTTSPVGGDESHDTDEIGSPGSKTMSRIRKLSLRRKKGPKLSISDTSTPLPGQDSLSPATITSLGTARSPASVISPGPSSAVLSPSSYLSSRDTGALTPASLQPVSPGGNNTVQTAESEGLAAASQPSAGFPGLSRVTSFRKRTREATSPEIASTSAWRPTSPLQPAPPDYAPAAAAIAGPASGQLGVAGRPAGLKRSGSLGGNFLTRSNTFLSKASSSTFGVASRKGLGSRNGRNGSMTNLSISGPVHLDADGEDGAMGRLGGGATVISGGPAEAFALLAARSANPGAMYLGSAFGAHSSATPATALISKTPTATPAAPPQASSAPFSVLSTHAQSPVADAVPTPPDTSREASPPFNKTSTPSSPSAPASKALALPRKSLNSVRGAPPLAQPTSKDIILPSEQIKTDYARPSSPQSKESMKAELAQQLDQVLHDPKAPTRRLAHNHNRTLTPHSISVHGSALPADLISEVMGLGGTTTSSGTIAGAAVSTGIPRAVRASLDGGISGPVSTDAPIVTIGPTGYTHGASRKASLDISSGRSSFDVGCGHQTIYKGSALEHGPLYGLGFQADGEELVRDSFFESPPAPPQPREPRDVPTSPFSHTTSPSATSDVPSGSGDSESTGVGAKHLRQSTLVGTGANNPAGPSTSARSQGRSRTLSLASMLGLGLPTPPSLASAAPSSGVGNTPALSSSVGSPALASQSHVEGQLAAMRSASASASVSQKNSIPDGSAPMSADAGAGSGNDAHADSAAYEHQPDNGNGNGHGNGVSSADASRPMSYATSGGHETHTRPMSFATSGGHEALNGHGHPASQSSHHEKGQGRLWYAMSGRRGSIGASQALASSVPVPPLPTAAAGADAVASSGASGLREDDAVADLPRASLGGSGASAVARQSVQSMQSGAGSSVHGHGYGHSRHGSNAYAASEAPSMETDGDAASVLNAQLVMASRVEVRRAGMGNTGVGAGDASRVCSHAHPTVSSVEHLDVDGKDDNDGSGEPRPVSLNDQQRDMLVAHTTREAAQDAGKVVDGQMLRPRVVEDAELRYSHQAVMMSCDDVRQSVAPGALVEVVNQDSSVPGAAGEEPVPPTPTSADSTRGSTGSRRRARKASYATAEEAIAARKQEQAEREERQRAREAKRQAERHARYANKKKADPLLATRLALFGLQPPSSDGHGDGSPAGDASGSLDGNANSTDPDRAHARGDSHASDVPHLFVSQDSELAGERGAMRPLTLPSDLPDMDEPRDVPLQSTGEDDAASMLVKRDDLASGDKPHQLRVLIADPDGLFVSSSTGDSLHGDAAGESYDSTEQPGFGGQGALSDWHSAHSHHPRHAPHAQAHQQQQQQQRLIPVPAIEAHRLSGASSFADYMSTMSHQN